MSVVDDNFLNDIMGSGASSPSAESGSVVDSSFADSLVGIEGVSAPKAEKMSEAQRSDNVRRANELSYKEGITFPEALKRIENEEVSFGKGVARTVGPAFVNRMVGMAQATGLDDLTANTLKKTGLLDKEADADAMLREGVTERKASIANTAEKAPAGAFVGELAGDALALAPAAPLAGSGLVGMTATGAIGGAIEGATRAEGTGEDQDRAFNAAVGTVTGGVGGAALGGLGVAYQRYFSDDVNRLLGKGVDVLKRKTERGTKRFSKQGAKLLRERGYNPDTIPTDTAADIFNTEAKAMTSSAKLQNQVGRILKNTDPTQVKENLARFDSLGIEPTLGQVTGDDTLLAIERNLALRGDPKISEPLRARMRTQAHEQLPVATQHLLKNFSRKSLDDVADQVVDAAQNIKKKMIDKRAAQAGPLYREALATGKRISKPGLPADQRTKLFHGTAKEFDNFDLSKMGTQTDDGFFGRGVYFGSGERGQGIAEEYATTAARDGGKARVMELLAPENMKVINSNAEAKALYKQAGIDSDVVMLKKADSEKLTEFLKGQGFKGVEMRHLNESVVFDPADLLRPGDDVPGVAPSILQHPRIKKIAAEIRKDPDFGPAVEGLSDDSVDFLHQVKLKLDDVIGKAGKERTKNRVALLQGLKKELVDEMDRATIATDDIPDLGVKAGESVYKKARRIFEDESKLIDTYQDSALGAIADLSEGRIDNATRKIFNMKDMKRFVQVKDEIRGENPALWDAMVARHVSDILEDLPAVPNKDYRAFARKLAGKERQGRFMQEALKDNPKSLKLFKDMMQAIDDLENLDVARYPKGSDTMPNFSRANWVDDHFASNKYKVLDKLSTDLFKDIADGQQQAYVSDVLSQLSRMLTNPESVNDLARGKIAGRLATYLMSDEGKALANARAGKVLNRHDRAMIFFRAAMGEQQVGKVLDTAGAVAKTPALLAAPSAARETLE